MTTKMVKRAMTDHQVIEVDNVSGKIQIQAEVVGAGDIGYSRGAEGKVVPVF